VWEVLKKFVSAWAMALCLVASPVGFAWTTVAPGIEYQEFTLPDPNNLYVARMDRDNLQTFVDTTLGGSRLGVSETIGSQASRYDEAINYWGEDWGQRNDVIVAVNGDFLDTSNNTPLMGQVMSGWYMKPITSGNRRFYFTLDRELAIGYGQPAQRFVSFLDAGQSIDVDNINTVRGTDELVLYTPQYNSTTGTDSTGVEVDVEMPRPALAAPSSDAPVGIIRQVRQNAGSTQIHFDHVILSATGAHATDLLASAQVGQRVQVVSNLDGYPVPFARTYASLGGGETFLGDGQVWGGQNVRHPRTAIAYNDKYLYFVVCDGRSTVSVGMTMTELGNFCKDYLGATWGINQDGGGSSTMLVNGVLKNDPSDGNQRAVVNGIFMGNRLAKQQSTTFSSGDIVKTSVSGNVLRAGPGTNWLQLTTIGNNQQATIVDHPLRGVYAKGYYWWKCNFNGTVGWMSQSLLTLVSANTTLPRFTQHPSAQSVCPGGNATFSVAATGPGTLGYQWYFQGVPISDNSSYSGSTTTTLSVANVGASLGGSYRCVATNANGSTTSYSAPLRVKAETVIFSQPTPPARPRVVRGTDLSFSVGARADDTLAYRWQRDGVYLSNSSKYAGVTTSTLTITSVDTYDEGSYQCAVAGDCGVVYSDAIPLTVLSTDFDRDLDVDQDDFAHLQACLSGTAIAQTDPACQDANLDDDSEGDVSPTDILLWLQCVSGPNVTRPPGC
jgi:hypothetical protein